MIQIEIINDSSRFYTMRKEWNDILDKSGIENPFLAHEFLSSWWRGYGKDKKLSVVVFKNGGAVIGLAPFAIVKTKLSGVPVKALQFFADHWGPMDFILAEKKAACIEQFVEWFVAAKGPDAMVLSRLPKQSENSAALEQALRGKKVNFENHAMKNVVININGSWEGYLAERSKKFRYQLKDKEKKLSQRGKIAYTRISDLADVQTALATMEGVSQKSWKGESDLGIAATHEGREFYRHLLAQWGREGKLNLSLLTFNAEPIAYAMRIANHHRYYALETAFDAAYYDYSPGMLVQRFLLQELLQEGRIKEYELGQSDDHKSRWTEDFAAEANFIVFKKNLYAGMIFCLRGILWILKKD